MMHHLVDPFGDLLRRVQWYRAGLLCCWTSLCEV